MRTSVWTWGWCAALLLCLPACESVGGGGSAGASGDTPRAAPPGPPHPIVVDLTQPLAPDIPVFPGGRPFTVETLAEIESGYYSRAFAMGEHTGTHVDAPGHFVAGQGLLDTIEVRDLVAPLVVIDVRTSCATYPDYTLDMAVLQGWETRHGRVPTGAVVVLYTGWESRWSNPAAYANADTNGVLHFPGFGVDVAEFLATKRGVRGLGIDTLSTDPGRSQDFAQHKAFLAHGLYQIENLRNLDLVPPTGATIIVGVLPIRNGSGAPARVLAIIPAGTP